MRKFYILAIALSFFAVDFNAQIIDDDFESYSSGSMGDQNPTVWRTWSGGFDTGEDLIVEFGFANSGDQSGLMADNGVQDVILQLGNLTSGDYTLQFFMYVYGGKTGYFNIQGTIPAGPVAGVFNSSNIYFNETGSTPGEGLDQTDGSIFSYPEDTWFPVSIYFDVDAATYQMSVNGTVVNASPVGFQADNTLGGLDFFSINSNNLYNLDDVLFVQGTLSTQGFEKNAFSVYPNPVADQLNIKSKEAVSKVAIYNELGQVLNVSTPNIVSPSFDMSTYKSGIYFVEVTIGNTTQTVKVIK